MRRRVGQRAAAIRTMPSAIRDSQSAVMRAAPPGQGLVWVGVPAVGVGGAAPGRHPAPRVSAGVGAPAKRFCVQTRAKVVVQLDERLLAAP